MFERKRARVVRLAADHLGNQSSGVQAGELGRRAGGGEASVPRDPMVGEAADGRTHGAAGLDERPRSEEGHPAVSNQLRQGVDLEAVVAQLPGEHPCRGGLDDPGVPGAGEDGGDCWEGCRGVVRWWNGSRG